ncbi:hypothetical protein [Frankia sp. AvcI1]|uniref:hypothetical protein n=1 Tax=Frankia sp. AvcI1 TaxID=573496 RepID=UPI002117C919|nr:hypothetical protein [Frankia sp. AvcI1]
MLKYDLDAPTRNPVDTLLRLMTITFDRAMFYADLQQEAYDAAERLRASAAQPGGIDEDAARDLDEVLARGGIATLVGKTWAADRDAGIYATGEALRGLTQMEYAERKLAAEMSTKAIAGGLAERQTKLLEQQAQLIAGFATALARRLGLDPTAPEVRASIAAELRAIDPS